MRRVTTLIVTVATSTCLAACAKSHDAPTPTTPSTPVATAPTQQEITSLSGDYTVTVTAAPTCTNLPEPIRTRKYKGSVQALSNTGAFAMALTEANLEAEQSMVSGNVNKKTLTLYVSSYEGMNRYENWPLVERLSNGGSISFMGQAEGVLGGQDQAISTVFNGVIGYCPAVNNAFFPIGCAVPPVECGSTQHLVKLERR